MSTTYNLEPPPTAKCILKTTSGDLQLELFAKQTPLASRNFLQHCLDGYYNNTIFHRLVPGFIIQGGDPTGTGSGGESAINNGAGFEDEVHSRLKFNRRGLLGMAKEEGGKENGSQFFLTLGDATELQGKHTMFGRVEGDTIYNLMKMGEAELVEGEGAERPLYPTRITGAEVLVNPFEDMAARVREAPRVIEDGGRKEVKKRKKPAGKNVLSFGGDDGEDEAAAPVMKKAKANPKLISVGQEEPEKMNNTAMPEPPAKKQQRQKREQDIPVPKAELEVTEVAAPVSRREPARDMDSEGDEPAPPTTKASALDRANAEIAALKASMKRTVDTAPKEKDRPRSALEAMIPTTSTRGRKRGKLTDERGALDMFKAFKQRLEDLPTNAQVAAGGSDEFKDAPAPAATNGHPVQPTTTKPAEADDDEAELCDLHFIANCQSCKSWDDDKPDGDAEADGEDDAAWMAHSLSFAKDTLGKDLEWKRKMDEIQIIDPREKARAIKEEKRKDKGKAKR